MHKNNRRKERGQTLVEFALTLPILLMLFIGIIDFGRVFFTYAQASNSLRQALRQAPNIGFSSSMPSYRDCARITDLANNVRTTTVTINIQYILANGSTVNCASVTDAMINNGDRMRITSTATIELWVLPTSLNMNLSGQRTIIKSLSIGSGSSGTDTDYDGLADTWETTNFGTLPAQTALGDADNDGCTNGAEEARGTNPNSPSSPAGGCS